MMRSITKSIIIGIPIGVLFFMALLWLAVGDDTEWYVIVGLGVGLGVLAAVLFGMLAGVTLNAHTRWKRSTAAERLTDPARALPAERATRPS